jgi:predicted RNA-binding protein YlxR (DUF448 family)
MVRLWRILGVSTFLIMVTRSLRRSWTAWLLKRMAKRQERAAKRALLLQLELESQLLRCKELDQQHQQLLHRQQETRESEEFHSPPAPPEKLGRPPRSLAE